MNVILLCAGYATRLYPLTEHRPKPLLPVAGKPIIEYIMKACCDAVTVDGFYIVTNDKFADTFEEWKKDCSGTVPIHVINDGTTSDTNKLGAIGDMAFAIEQGRLSGATLVVAGDNLFDFPLQPFFAFTQQCPGEVVVGGYDVGDRELAKRYGILAVDDKGHVTSFVEKPADPPSTFASLGLYYFSEHGRALISEYLAGGGNKDQPGHYIKWLSENYTAYAYVFRGHWFDIGDMQSYEKAQEFYHKKQ